MQCGHEKGGLLEEKAGLCPVSVDTVHDGINSGAFGGRFCWAVAGTMCNGKVQGTFAEKRQSCVQCPFYKLVRAEEGSLNIRTKFLKFVRPNSKSAFFKNLTHERIRQGQRFIVQGSAGDTAYIIQQGSCIVLVETSQGMIPVGHRGEGDIVGMISLLTGEPTGFHTEAETDMDVWVITKKEFDCIPDQDPELFSFLTELVADRLDRKGPIAERMIGKYLITDILGRGGYSIVYKGLHTDLRRPVAIKMMRHHFSMQPELMRGFLNEARIIAGLSHVNIVSVFDIEFRYKTIFIVYEYLDGHSLLDMIQSLIKIPPSLALTYLCQIVSALCYAGEKGLVHRDINPSNVIVLPGDRVKLIDFGLAGQVAAQDFTMDGNINYLAPEMLDAEPADFRTDMYSLGVTAFHMITGHLPFVTDDPAKRMTMMKTGDTPDPGKELDHLPEVLREFILKACQRNPDQRFQTPDQAREFLSRGNEPTRNPVFPSAGKKSQNIAFEIDPDREEEFLILLSEFDHRLKTINSRILYSNKELSDDIG